MKRRSSQRRSLGLRRRRSSIRAKINKHGDEIQACPWGRLNPSLKETALSYDTVTEREMGDQVASRQVSDSFGMLVGYSAPDAILFSKLNKKTTFAHKSNRWEEERRWWEGGPVPSRSAQAHLRLLLFILNKYYSTESQRTLGAECVLIMKFQIKAPILIPAGYSDPLHDCQYKGEVMAPFAVPNPPSYLKLNGRWSENACCRSLWNN